MHYTVTELALNISQDFLDNFGPISLLTSMEKFQTRTETKTLHPCFSMRGGGWVMNNESMIRVNILKCTFKFI